MAVASVRLGCDGGDGVWGARDSQLKLTPERLLILVMVAILIWCGSAIVRLEGYRYAESLGMCHQHHPDLVRLDDCMRHAETRTHPLWHLLHELGVV
jgi:hypothetical protein